MLERIKRLRGIVGDGQDQMIKDVIELTRQKLLSRLEGVETVPAELEFIILEVTIKRLNRIGAEGMAKKTLEGLTTEFSNDDFQEFEADIEKYNAQKSEDGQSGVVLFY